MRGTRRLPQANICAWLSARQFIFFVVLLSAGFIDSWPATAADPPARTAYVEPWAWEWVDTDTERRVLNALCAGRPAVMRGIRDPIPDPDGPRTEERRLTSTFLQLVLVDRPCATKPFPHRGVHIYGAWIDEKIDLSGARIDRDVWFEDSIFDEDVSFDRVNSGAFIKFDRSLLTKTLSFADAEVAGDLLLHDSSYAGDLNLSGAKIGRDLSLAGANILKNLNASAAHIYGELNLNRLKAVALNEPRRLDFSRATVERQVLLNNVVLSGDVNVNMDGIQIGGSLNAYWLNRDTEEAGEPLPWAGRWHLYNARIGGDFKLVNAELSELIMLNMTGTRINGTLFLGSWDFTDDTGDLLLNSWGENSRLILRNANVQSVVDAVSNGRDSWPNSHNPMHQSLELDGFVYASWGGLDKQFRDVDGAAVAVSPRDSTWLIRWLQRDITFTPQPYEQLSGVVAKQGMQAAASQVLFYRYEYERRRAWGYEGPHANGAMASTIGRAHADDGEQSIPPKDASNVYRDWGKAIVLQLKWLLNGYGFRPYYTVLWFVVLIVIGTFLFKLTYQRQTKKNVSLQFATEYTVDTLLPAVSISKEFEDISIDDRWVRYYFIILKPLSFLFIAALLKTASDFATGTIE